MITIEVSNVTSKLVPAPSPEITEKIREKLRYKNDAANPFAMRQMNKKSNFKKNFAIAEYKYLYHKGRKTFPSGLLEQVKKVLENNNVKYQVKDLRPSYPIKDPIKLKNYILRDYQESSKKKALDAQNGMVRIATGGGKTAIMASICADLNGYGRVIFVRRQMLLAQTIEVFERELGIKVGQIGAGVVDIQPLTIAMIPSVARAIDPKWKFTKENDDDEDDETKLSDTEKAEIKKYLEQVECLIIDECHCIGSDTAQLVAKTAKNARYRLGFSATPWRDDGKDILLSAVTGERIVDIDASYLIERDFLVPPHIYYFKTPPVRIPLFQQGKYQDVYKEFIVDNPNRNALILMKAIEAYERYEKVLILVQQVDHGKMLLEYLEEQGIWAEYISGSKTMISRGEIVRDFQSRSRSILIGTNGTLSEGVDIPEITVLINASGGKSSVQYYQKIGRAIRTAEDKKRAIIIDFLDQNIRFMQKHAEARIKLIKTERLYKLKVQE